MRLKVPFKGIHVGDHCVDGSEFGKRVEAHAHLGRGKFAGYICARNNYAMMKYLRHEVAHLLTGATHESDAEEAQWRTGLRSIGGRIAAKTPRQR